MSDDLIAGAKWTLENAAGMTLENEEVRQLCDMADRIEKLEAKLAKAVEALVRIADTPAEMTWGVDSEVREAMNGMETIAEATLAELTGDKND